MKNVTLKKIVSILLVIAFINTTIVDSNAIDFSNMSTDNINIEHTETVVENETDSTEVDNEGLGVENNAVDTENNNEAPSNIEQLPEEIENSIKDNQLIVKFKEKKDQGEVESFIESKTANDFGNNIGLRMFSAVQETNTVETIEDTNISIVSTQNKESAEQLEIELQNDDEVEYVQKNYVIYANMADDSASDEPQGTNEDNNSDGEQSPDESNGTDLTDTEETDNTDVDTGNTETDTDNTETDIDTDTDTDNTDTDTDTDTDNTDTDTDNTETETDADKNGGLEETENVLPPVVEEVPEIPPNSIQETSYATFEDGLQWGIKNIGQIINGSEGASETDINIEPFYSEEKEIDDVVVALIDTGIDTNHKDLKDFMLPGYDFFNSDETVFDDGDTSHGTQIAGIIARNTDEIGIKGVATNAKILPIKFMQDGYGYTSDAILAIEYAHANGAKVVNVSWGTNNESPILKDVMSNYSDMLFVCAAGNDSLEQSIYPAAYDLPNVISVASIDNKGELSTFSNFGNTINVAAPGTDIYTTFKNSEYGFASGTSMSTGFVSGIATLKFGLNEETKPQDIKYAIMQSVTKSDKLVNLVYSSGFVNAEKALTFSGINEGIVSDAKFLYPKEVLEIIDSERLYTELTDAEKELLEEYLFVRSDTMTTCALAGFNLRASIQKALIMQRLGISLEETLQAIQKFKSESVAANEVLSFVNMQFKYSNLNNVEASNVKDLLIAGFRARQAVNVYIVSQALTAEFSDLVAEAPEVFSEDEIESLSAAFSGAEKEDFKLICDAYNLNPKKIVEYCKENSANPLEMKKLIMEYHSNSDILIEEVYDDKVTPEASPSDFTQKKAGEIEGKKYLDNNFVFNSGGNDSINKNTGELVYQDNIVQIPGKNGLNLDLSLNYSSGEATPYDMYKNWQYSEFYGIKLVVAYRVLSDYPEMMEVAYSKDASELNAIWRDLTIQLQNDYEQTGNTYITFWKDGMYRDYHINQYYINGNSVYAILAEVYSMVTLDEPGVFEVYYDYLDYLKYNTPLKKFMYPWTYLKTGQAEYNNAFSRRRTDSETNELRSKKIETPFESMGDGWSLNYPRVIIDDTLSTKYLRMPGGSTYEYSKGANSANLKNYLLSDMQFSEDLGNAYGNPNSISKYILKLKDGTVNYFDGKGRIIGIKDRFGNTIDFKHNISSGYNGNTVITDTVGQKTTLTYTPSKATFMFPDNSKVEYDLTKSGAITSLSKKTDKLGLSTTFDYSTDSAAFNFFTTKVTPGTIYYNMLKGVNYPTGAKSVFSYEKTNGKIGTQGTTEILRLKNRYDYADGVNYNLKNFTYSAANYSGALNNSAYRYDTTETDSNGVSQTTFFNGDHFPITETLSVSGTKKSNSEYTYDSKKQLTQQKTTVTENGKTQDTYELFTFDNYRNLTEHYGKGALGNRSNTEYKKTNVYEPKYQLLTSSTYKRDNANIIKEEFVLSTDKKTVTESNVYENNSLQAKTSFVYNNFGNVISTTRHISNSESVTTNFELQNEVFVSGETTGDVSRSKTYDIYGRTLSETDGNGNTTHFTYDEAGRITSKTNPDGTVVTNEIDDISRTYVVTNENGLKLKSTFDQLGNLLRVENVNDGVVLNSYAYNSKMLVTSEKDAKNTETIYTYDNFDRATSKTIGGNLYKQTFVYQDVYDSLLSKVTINVEGDSNSPTLTKSYYTDVFGNRAKESMVINGAEKFIVHQYDYLGNVVQSTDLNGNVTKFAYNFGGKPVQTVNPDSSVYKTTYNWLGEKTSSTDPSGNIFSFFYDKNGNLVKQESPFEQQYKAVTTNVYDKNGNVVSTRVTNSAPGEQGSETRTDFDYNNRNFMTKTTMYDGNVASNFVTYSYDAAGNKTQMTTANGTQTTNYEYDQQNRLLKMTDPLGMFETYSYDISGNLVAKTDKNKNTFTNSYDVFNKVVNVSVKYSGNVTLPENMSINYAKNGAKISESNENISISYVFDDASRLLKETDSTGTEKTYTYDTNGNRKTFVAKINGNLKLSSTYDYDNMNRLTKVYESGILKATYTYDANGNRKTMTYANGVTTEYSYNNANLVTKLTNQSGANVVSSYSYAYNLDGNQSKKTDNTGRTTAYTYDNFGRLTKESDTFSSITTNKVYNFDDAGNRKSMTVAKTGESPYKTDYVYDKNNRLLSETKIGATTTDVSEYQYDENGNQLSKLGYTISDDSSGFDVYKIISLGYFANQLKLPEDITNEDESTQNNTNQTELMTYDAFNRLKTAENEKYTAAYLYNPNGMRLSKEVNGERTTHVWDGSNIVMDLNSVGAIQDRYIRGVNLIASDKSGYYNYNAHGDVTQLTSASGEIAKNYNYDAFGVEENIDYADVNPFRYCGEYYDSNSGNYYLRARYYSPATGIFLSEDPIRDGLNWYTYCTNDPLNFIDPDGTDPFRQKHYHEAATVAWQARKESGIDSMFIGMIPIVGDAKDIQEATTGVDLVTGEKLSKLDRGFTVVAAMLPVVNGKMARTGLDMGGEAASIVAKNMDGALGTLTKNGDIAFDTAIHSGVAASRINISNEGWGHILKEHFSLKNKSQFTISQDSLKSLLQNKDVIGTSITKTINSKDGIRYSRVFDAGYNIGTDKFNNFNATSIMTILSDKHGNLVTAFPGVLK